MNREQREQYEQVTADTPFNQIQTQTLEGSPVVFSQGLARHSVFQLSGTTRDTPFFVRGFPVFRGENYNGHSL